MSLSMDFKQAAVLPFDSREQISHIFTVGFYQWLKYFSKDKERLARSLAHMFDLNKFYVAVEDDKIAAITACTDGKSSPIHLEKRELRRHLGFVGGSIAFIMLNIYLVNHPYPFEIEETTGSIEIVATAPEYRGQGVARSLIEYVIAATHYSEYVLEVADTNTTAVRLYEHLGFAEFMRMPEKHPNQSGLNFYVYMRKIKK